MKMAEYNIVTGLTELLSGVRSQEQLIAVLTKFCVNKNKLYEERLGEVLGWQYRDGVDLDISNNIIRVFTNYQLNLFHYAGWVNIPIRDSIFILYV